MVTAPPYSAMSKSDLIGIIETQQKVIQRFYRLLPVSNKKFSPVEKLALAAAKPLVDKEKPNERGLVRLPIDESAEAIGMSDSTTGRALKNVCDRFDATYELVDYTTKKGQRCKLVYVNPADPLWNQYPDELELPPEKERAINGNGKYCPSCRTNNLQITTRRLTYQEVQECQCCHYRKVSRILDDPDNDPLPPMEYWPPKIGEEEKGPQAEDLLEDEQDQEKGLTSETLTYTQSLVDTTPDVPTEKGLQPGEPFRNIPAELDGRIWICWRWEKVKGKWTKVPYLADMKGETKIDATDLGNGRTFAYALSCLEASKEWANPYDGIGFMCDGSFVGIDLDHCRNKETGEIAPWAQAIIDRFPPTYSYITPSEEGVRLIVHAKKPGPRCKKGNIEIYEKDRFFTWTPRTLPGTPASIADGQEALEVFYHETFPAPEPEPPTDQGPLWNGREEDRQDDQSDEEMQAILDKAMNARNGAKFALLREGRWQEVKNTRSEQYYPSQSEADQAYCHMLAYWGGSVSTIDRLFRRSGLYRAEDWDSPARTGETYGEGTIRRAIEGLHDRT